MTGLSLRSAGTVLALLVTLAAMGLLRPNS